MPLSAEAGHPGGVAVADQLVKPCRLLHIHCMTVAGKFSTNTVKFFARIERVPQFVNQFIVFVADAAVKIHEQAVAVVVNLKVIARGLVKQHPAAAEHFKITFIDQSEKLPRIDVSDFKRL